MFDYPLEYRWSSYRSIAQVEDSELVTPHPLYLALGVDGAIPQKAYRELFRYELELGVVGAIRQATNRNFALGDGCFGEQIALVSGRRVQPGKSGRPCKLPVPETGVLYFWQGKTRRQCWSA